MSQIERALEEERRIIDAATIEGFPDYEVDEEGCIYSTLKTLLTAKPTEEPREARTTASPS